MITDELREQSKPIRLSRYTKYYYTKASSAYCILTYFYTAALFFDSLPTRMLVTYFAAGSWVVLL